MNNPCLQIIIYWHRTGLFWFLKLFWSDLYFATHVSKCSRKWKNLSRKLISSISSPIFINEERWWSDLIFYWMLMFRWLYRVFYGDQLIISWQFYFKRNRNGAEMEKDRVRNYFPKNICLYIYIDIYSRKMHVKYELAKSQKRRWAYKISRKIWNVKAN